MARRRRWGWCSPAVLVTALYCLLSAGSLAWVVMSSLKTNTEILSTSPWALPEDPSLDAYTGAWEGGNLGPYFLASVVVLVVSILGGLVISTPAAYALARARFSGRAPLQFLLQVGIIVPSFTIVIPVYFLLKDAGILGSYGALVLVYVGIQIPFTVYVLRPFFERLPAELEEAAHMDGAGPFRTFFTVMMPLAAPAIVSLGVLNAIFIWNEFLYAFLLQSAGDDLTLPLGLVRLAQAAEFRAEWVELLAGVVISTAPILILFAVFQRRIEQGLTAGALK